MRNSNQFRSRALLAPGGAPSHLRTLVCGIMVSAALIGVGSTAKAASYDEITNGDLSNVPGAPTNIGTLTLGDNYVVGSSVPSGAAIPNGHGALVNQDNDFFTFTVPVGDVLSHFTIVGDSSIVQGDRLFLGIYPGNTSPVDPGNPSPAGLLGYSLPGAPQIGSDVLPALAASNDPGFPPLPTHFSGSLGAGEYTVWLVDGDSPVHYDIDLAVAAAPEPTTWVLMIAGIGLIGGMFRRHRFGTVRGIVA